MYIAAGTTDGCASFLATGANSIGDGVTALGTSPTLKLLSYKPIFAPRFGVYTHRLLDMWLAGGGANSGGAALLAHFPPDEIETLRTLIDPETDTGLDYYPLTRKGEQFPIADPEYPPRMTPRPESLRNIPAGDPGRNCQHRGARLPKARRTRGTRACLDAHGRRRDEESRLDSHPREKALRPVH